MKEIIRLVKEKPFYFFKRFNQKTRHRIEDNIRLASGKTVRGIVNDKELRIHGLRRTGNHAIINWIVKQATGTVVHINDIFIDENPFIMTVEALESNDPDFIWRAKRMKGIPLYKEENGLDILKKEATQQFLHKDILIYSLEDYSLNLISKEKIQKKHLLYFGNSQTKFDVIILRDPFNLLASRLKNKDIGLKTRSWHRTFASVWVEYAKEYLGETNYLPYEKLVINYNQWASNKTYRKQLAEKLGIPFTDAGFDQVTNYGGGSSFDGSGSKSALDVFGRWKHFKDDPVFKKVASNKELLHYAKLIYPEFTDVGKEIRI